MWITVVEAVSSRVQFWRLFQPRALYSRCSTTSTSIHPPTWCRSHLEDRKGEDQLAVECIEIIAILMTEHTKFTVWTTCLCFLPSRNNNICSASPCYLDSREVVWSPVGIALGLVIKIPFQYNPKTNEGTWTNTPDFFQENQPSEVHFRVGKAWHYLGTYERLEGMIVLSPQLLEQVYPEVCVWFSFFVVVIKEKFQEIKVCIRPYNTFPRPRPSFSNKDD